MTVIVELKIAAYIDNLPDGMDNAELSEDQIEDVEDIARCALPQNLEMYYYGEDKRPVKIFIEAFETEDIRVE